MIEDVEILIAEDYEKRLEVQSIQADFTEYPEPPHLGQIVSLKDFKVGWLNGDWLVTNLERI